MLPAIPVPAAASHPTAYISFRKREKREERRKGEEEKKRKESLYEILGRFLEEDLGMVILSSSVSILMPPTGYAHATGYLSHLTCHPSLLLAPSLHTLPSPHYAALRLNLLCILQFLH